MCSDSAFQRSTLEILVRLLSACLGDASFDSDLSFQLSPEEQKAFMAERGPFRDIKDAVSTLVTGKRTTVIGKMQAKLMEKISGFSEKILKVI
jgi:hypothetical protein